MANRDEVEEFLRRAAARRAAAQAQQQQRQQSPPQWIAPQPPPKQPPPAPRRPGSLAEVVMLEPSEPLQAEVIEVELAEEQDRLGRLVAQHMRGTEQIGEHARQLGEEVDLADDKLEARLHKVFDHKVGDLKSSTMEAAAASPSQAARDAPLPGAAHIAAMLANPQSLRSAVILAEILQRPEHQW